MGAGHGATGAPDIIELGAGSTFAFVSGLLGRAFDGNPRRARAYFKDLDGRIADELDIEARWAPRAPARGAVAARRHPRSTLLHHSKRATSSLAKDQKAAIQRRTGSYISDRPWSLSHACATP